MRMPAARNLFHRAIVQSGSMRTYRSPSDSRRVGEALVKKLGIEGRDLAKLQQLPYDQLMTSATEELLDVVAYPFEGGDKVEHACIGREAEIIPSGA